MRKTSGRSWAFDGLEPARQGIQKLPTGQAWQAVPTRLEECYHHQNRRHSRELGQLFTSILKTRRQGCGSFVACSFKCSRAKILSVLLAVKNYSILLDSDVDPEPAGQQPSTHTGQANHTCLSLAVPGGRTLETSLAGAACMSNSGGAAKFATVAGAETPWMLGPEAASKRACCKWSRHSCINSPLSARCGSGPGAGAMLLWLLRPRAPEPGQAAKAHGKLRPREI